MWINGAYQPLPQCPDIPLMRLYQAVEPGAVDAAKNSVDAIHLAGQLGRLDLVAVLLAVFGLVAIFGGLFGLGYVRGQTYAIAKAEAERIAEERLTVLLKEIRDGMDDWKSAMSIRREPTSEPATGTVEEATPERRS
jgi:hypothetical protein